MLSRDDILCPYPDNQPLCVNHCGYSAILQQACELIYMGKPRPLREVYSTAEALYLQIEQWAEENGLLPDSEGKGNKELLSDDVSKLMLYSGK